MGILSLIEGILSLIEGSYFFGLLYRLSMYYCLSEGDSADVFRKGKAPNAVDSLEQGPPKIFMTKGLHRFLWSGWRATCGKILINSKPNCLN
jgi:hypothetical protein